MENRGRLLRASTQYVVQRSIKRDGSIHTEKLDSATSKRVGVGWYQLPLMLFAAKAQDRHARTIISKIDRNDRWRSQWPATEPCSACCAAMISPKIVSRSRLMLHFG